MGSRREHGGRPPPRCLGRSRRRSGPQPRRPCRTIRRSCSSQLSLFVLCFEANSGTVSHALGGGSSPPRRCITSIECGRAIRRSASNTRKIVAVPGLLPRGPEAGGRVLPPFAHQRATRGTAAAHLRKRTRSL